MTSVTNFKIQLCLAGSSRVPNQHHEQTTSAETFCLVCSWRLGDAENKVSDRRNRENQKTTVLSKLLKLSQHCPIFSLKKTFKKKQSQDYPERRSSIHFNRQLIFKTQQNLICGKLPIPFFPSVIILAMSKQK